MKTFTINLTLDRQTSGVALRVGYQYYPPVLPYLDGDRDQLRAEPSFISIEWINPAGAWDSLSKEEQQSVKDACLALHENKYEKRSTLNQFI